MASGVEREADIVSRQAGILTTAQAASLGLSRDQVRHRVRRGSWRPMHPGVYLTHPGVPDFAARVWAGLLHAGPTAVASHHTAARLQGLVDVEPDRIDLTIDDAARGHARPGLQIHRSLHVQARRHPVRLPPQTRIEDTVLDLVAQARSPDDVVAWVLRACQRLLTTPARLAVAAERRSRLAGRSLLMEVIGESSDGVASPLERRYRQDVEIAHALPRAERGKQWVGPDGRKRYYDVRYPTWRLRIELEGLAYHPSDRSHVDAARDNAAVLLGDVVLRYGWRAVVGDPCQVAAQVSAVLELRGWGRGLVPCGSSCRAPRP